MRREAPRTLFSLCKEYQLNTQGFTYDVVCIDHGSSEPIDCGQLFKTNDYFKYYRIDTAAKSPCAEINRAVAGSDSDYVMVCIDGARILSPGILSKSMHAAQLHSNPFCFTLNAHLGHELQYQALAKGTYSTAIEDALLGEIDWQNDGYKLFNIACAGGSGSNLLNAPPSETNTLFMRRETYLKLGGFNERFTSDGGGLCNLEFFDRAACDSKIQPVMLVGEATFHQYHGGVVTAATGPNREARFELMHKEYQQIIQKPYAKAIHPMSFFGEPNQDWTQFIESIW